MNLEKMLTETVFLYFFSAAFQGLAAILGLLVVFAIFRLQQFSSSIDGARNELYSDKGHSTHPEFVERFERLTHVEKKAFIVNKDNKTGSLPIFRSWVSAEEKMIGLKDVIRKPFGLLAVALLFNISALPFSVFVASWSPWMRLLVVAGDLGLIGVALIWNLAVADDLVKSSVA